MIYHKVITLLLLLLLSFPSSAQDLRALSPDRQTYALVIGISDYSNTKIPDLQFAHIDAQKFVAYLLNQEGGSISEDNIWLLTNQEATEGKITNGFTWLINETTEGDKAIIYFSGHGDVESSLYDYTGYFLAYDAPHEVYYNGGAIDLMLLYKIIRTLGAKGVEVILISDACRAGKLAGSSINGTSTAAAALLELRMDISKILSCQPNEYSLEGTQWGGGRGAFSYHLIDGLYGLADEDNDMRVSLLEIERYVQDKVKRETAPYSQIPVVKGNLSKTISYVNSEELADIESIKKNEPIQFSKINNRGLEEVIISQVDSTLVQLYESFKKALKTGNLLSPEGQSANDFYNILIKEYSVKPLHNLMTRSFAAALQEDAQVILNALMDSDFIELTKSRIIRSKEYSIYPRYLEKAAELLGETHYMYSVLKGRQHFFEGLIMWLNDPYSKDIGYGNQILDEYNRSLNYNPKAPHTLFYLGCCYATIFENKDSTDLYCKKANQLAETWVLPIAYNAHYHSKIFNDSQKAKSLLDQAMGIDSTDSFVLKTLGNWYFYQERYKEASNTYQRVVAILPDNFIAWMNLGNSFLVQGDYDKAEENLLKALEVDSKQYLGFHYLGLTYLNAGKDDLAIKTFNKAIEINPKSTKSRWNLGRAYLKANQTDNAIKAYQGILSYDSLDLDTHWKLTEMFYEQADYNLAEHHLIEISKIDATDLDALYSIGHIAAINKDLAKCLEYLEKAFVKGFNDWEYLKEDEVFDEFRKYDSFNRLIEYHNNN